MTKSLKYLMFFILLVAFQNSYAQVINAGVGGNNSQDLLDRLAEDVLNEKPNLVILMVGTNDMLNTKKMISYNRYSQNLEKLVATIVKNDSKLILMSPPPADSSYLFERHDKKRYIQAPNVKLDSARNIVSQIAQKYQLGFIDLFQTFSKMELPKHNKDLFIRNERNSGVKDGVHPTALGYQFIGETVFYFLKDHKLLKPKQKIICFGDSITRGTIAKGRTYPKALVAKIELN